MKSEVQDRAEAMFVRLLAAAFAAVAVTCLVCIAYLVVLRHGMAEVFRPRWR